ncbi:SDR family NAD(P)-dependent oxidoreductase [Clostridium sp. 001]|uniref:SDR family NAD(P)-dependent oxidoreductase n=1 Tax=Clostridium sp. 001 TaxID=1970093 RepID=UPI001C761441|nr:SDR family NAD(P)-dependent oxidoreductase [Clostridium sp. 001]QXE17417.1 hypothetical protein B5S50_00335 [Clostridium sp. 001]
MTLTNEKTVLITGASNGIGLELAKLFSKDGYNLILVARSENKLVEIAKNLIKKYNTQLSQDKKTNFSLM